MSFLEQRIVWAPHDAFQRVLSFLRLDEGAEMCRHVNDVRYGGLLLVVEEMRSG